MVGDWLEELGDDAGDQDSTHHERSHEPPGDLPVQTWVGSGDELDVLAKPEAKKKSESACL